ncbi:MAG: hypothetical protein IH626_01870 [Rhodospirillales bacterium]|nr:hypothetical protein [Rhodospirillales bacterium]
MERYITIVDGQPVGQPYAKPSRIVLPSGAVVGCAHWPAGEFLAHGKALVVGAADPETEVETGYTFDAGTGTAAPIVEPRPLAPMRAEAVAQIDRDAEAARLAFITGGSGQALVYKRKAEQAHDCLANHDAQNPPPTDKYPALEAEVGITGADVLGVATVVTGLEAAWGDIADAIEAIRLGAKRDVEAATTPTEIRDVVSAIAWPQPNT